MAVPPPFPDKTYEVVYVDPPWFYYGDQNKMGAAGKEYDLMTQEELYDLPVRSILAKKAAVFMWATGPRLDYAIDLIRAWGLHYRGVAYVWVKTDQNGNPIHGQGVRPTFTKPTTELVLAATTHPTGRPFPILDEGQPQVVLAPRGRHSQKPLVFRDLIEDLCGDRPRIEMFARGAKPGWDAWGLEAGFAPGVNHELPLLRPVPSPASVEAEQATLFG